MSTLKQIEQAGFKVGSLINIKGSGTNNNHSEKRVIVRLDKDYVYYTKGISALEYNKPTKYLLRDFELAESLPLGNSKTNEPSKFNQGEIYIDKSTGSKMLILSKTNTIKIYALHKNERIVKYSREAFLDSIELTDEGLPNIHTTMDIRSLSLIMGSATVVIRDVLNSMVYFVKPEDAFNTKAVEHDTSVTAFNNNFKAITFVNGDKVTEQSKLPVDSKEEKSESPTPEETISEEVLESNEISEGQLYYCKSTNQLFKVYNLEDSFLTLLNITNIDSLCTISKSALLSQYINVMTYLKVGSKFKYKSGSTSLLEVKVRRFKDVSVSYSTNGSMSVTTTSMIDFIRDTIPYKEESRITEETTYKLGSRLELISGGYKGTFASIIDYNKDSGIYKIYEDAEKRNYSFSKEYVDKYYKLADKETSVDAKPLTHKYPIGTTLYSRKDSSTDDIVAYDGDSYVVFDSYLRRSLTLTEKKLEHTYTTIKQQPITPLESVREPDVDSVGVDSKGYNELIVSPDLSPEEPLEEEVYHEPEMPSFPPSVSREQNTDDIELEDCINPLPLEPIKTIPYKGKHTMLSMDFDFDDGIVEFEF